MKARFEMRQGGEPSVHAIWVRCRQEKQEEEEKVRVQEWQGGDST
jgi:hypothetical protein